MMLRREFPILLSALLAMLAAVSTATAQEGTPFVSSPDGHVDVIFALDDAGSPQYAVLLRDRVLIEPSPLGLVATHAWWDRDLELVGSSDAESIDEEYDLAHGKRRHVRYQANRRSVRLADSTGQVFEIEFHVSNDGVAFRYRIPAASEPRRVTVDRELTGFRFDPAARSWLMPMDHPLTGWEQTNPSYEAHYVMDQPVGLESPTEVGWAFPGLFHRNGVGWALITDSGVDSTYVAGRLVAEAERGLYRFGFPDRGEGTGPDDPVDPSFYLPFASPWRVIVVGETLAPIVESTLVTDVSTPSVVSDTSWIKPGKAAWSWLALKDESIVPDVQRAFIDMAAEYGFEYTLVDNWWDRQIGHDGLAELAQYAAERGVALIAWYNSNGNFNGAPQTPQDRMDTAEARRAEFKWLREMGIGGVKVDFMAGDKQSVMKLYQEILEDAADYQILVNFHGATLPRGWQRTYPHLVSLESVRGYEYITFDQFNADAAPTHGAVLPFTRNAVGPMDFTPTMLAERVGNSARRTSNGYELGMLVAFESGVQHLGVTPEVMASLPEYVRTYISEVPAAWDDTRFVDGYPGAFVVLARRSGSRWYVAGLNGSDEQRSVRLDLPFVGANWNGTLLTDGEGLFGFDRGDVSNGDIVKMRGWGGFVVVIDLDD